MLRLSIPNSSPGRIQNQSYRLSRMNMDQDLDEVQSNLNDYQELLQSEVYVDLDRLRILARQGVPHQIRGVKQKKEGRNVG